jgi:hypothetical protein
MTNQTDAESQRRDFAMTHLGTVKGMLDLARQCIQGDSYYNDPEWAEPLRDCDDALASIDGIFTTVSRIEEYLHGDMDDQIQRWLADPVRSDLLTAAKTAGVDGFIRCTFGKPTDLGKRSLDYRVVRINRCSVRLRDQRNLTEKTVTFDSWDERHYQRWSVVAQ